MAYGVLTARHVASRLRRQESVYLAFPRRTRSIPIFARHLIFHLSREGNSPEFGPDLAFIQFPTARLSGLKSIGSFVDLLVHQQRAESLDRGDGSWILCGYPDESSSVAQSDEGPTLNLLGQCFIGPQPESHTSDAEFDYYESRARYSERSTLPESFGGVSGGGLWQAESKLENKRWSVFNPVFRGVAFHQSVRNEDSRHIRSHAETGIYTWLEQLIAN